MGPTLFLAATIATPAFATWPKVSNPDLAHFCMEYGLRES
jgi:hypothetical protein